MRNEVPDDNENVYNSVVARRNRRRKQAIAGAAGLAVLGAGAFLVTSQVVDENRTETREAAALAPAVPEPTGPEASAASASVAASASPSASATVSSSAVPTVSPTREKSRAERIDEVKGTAAKANNVRRPLPATGARPVKDVTVKETGSLETGGTLRVVSGRGDLTGQRELALAADQGKPVGAARCTQKVRFSAGAPAVERPTLMICWRTSATRSVFTVAVAAKGRPSAEKSVAAIARQWAKLG